MADHSDCRPGLELEVDPVEDGPARRVLEADSLVGDPTRPRRQLRRPGPLGNVLRLVHHLEDPIAGSRRALRLPDPHAEHPQRHHEHQDEDVEEDEVVQRKGVVHDHAPAHEQHRPLRQQR